MGNWPWRTATVLTFTVALVIQGYLSFAIKPEPYPSIRMPNFGTAASKDGTFQITLARADVISADSSVHPLSPTALMAEFRFSTARPSYDYLFLSSDLGKITPAVKAWLKARIYAIDGGYEPVELRMCWQRSTISLANAAVVTESPCRWKAVKL